MCHHPQSTEDVIVRDGLVVKYIHIWLITIVMLPPNALRNYFLFLVLISATWCGPCKM